MLFRSDKDDPAQLTDTVVCYVDATIALRLLTHYALATHEKRPLKRRYDRRDKLMKNLRSRFRKHTPTGGGSSQKSKV